MNRSIEQNLKEENSLKYIENLVITLASEISGKERLFNK